MNNRKALLTGVGGQENRVASIERSRAKKEGVFDRQSHSLSLA